MAEIKKATIKDVAQAAGCSVASVCYAFSGSDKIREETRERILAAARKLGYVPNKAAQSLSRNPKHIGVVIPDSYDEVMSLFKQGIIDAVNSYMWCQLDYTMFGYEWYSNESQQKALEALLSMPKCDGMILCLSYADPISMRDCFDRLRATGKPIVCISDSTPEVPCVATVGVDTEAIGEAAAHVLYSCGCRRVSLIVGDYATNSMHRGNAAGFHRRAAELGMCITTPGISYNDAEIAYRATQDVLMHDAPDGLFVTSYIAAAVCRAVKDAGQAGRVKIVSVDLCNGVSEVLASGELVASFYQNQPEQGRCATNILIDAIFSGAAKNGERVNVKPEIVVRELLKYYSDK